MIWRLIKISVGSYFFSSLLFLTLLLATFLLNNYEQALAILKDSPVVLARVMDDMDISDAGVFAKWLDEERVYLQGLKTEPEGETLQMEYYQKLINLWASE